MIIDPNRDDLEQNWPDGREDWDDFEDCEAMDADADADADADVDAMDAMDAIDAFEAFKAAYGSRDGAGLETDGEGDAGGDVDETGADSGSDADLDASQIDRLREFFRAQIGTGKRFGTAREMADALNLPQSRSTVLYKFLKGAEPRAGIVLEWLERLGINVLLPDNAPRGVEFLPVMNCRAGAGVYLPSSPEDGQFKAIRAFDSDYFRRMHINPASCCFLDVQGDSMEPLFSDGSTLMVDMSEDAKHYLVDGKIYVVRYEDGVLVKRIHFASSEIVLLSENPLHAPVRIDNPEAFEVIGRVRWYSVNA